MWVPTAVVDWFKISKESVDALREELSAVRAERDVVKTQLLIAQSNFEWLRLRINALEVERAQLFEKAYNVKFPVPEIVRAADPITNQINQFSFDDMGDDLAKKLGLPTYDN